MGSRREEAADLTTKLRASERTAAAAVRRTEVGTVAANAAAEPALKATPKARRDKAEAPTETPKKRKEKTADATAASTTVSETPDAAKRKPAGERRAKKAPSTKSADSEPPTPTDATSQAAAGAAGAEGTPRAFPPVRPLQPTMDFFDLLERASARVLDDQVFEARRPTLQAMVAAGGASAEPAAGSATPERPQPGSAAKGPNLFKRLTQSLSKTPIAESGSEDTSQ